MILLCPFMHIPVTPYFWMADVQLTDHHEKLIIKFVDTLLDLKKPMAAVGLA